MRKVKMRYGAESLPNVPAGSGSSWKLLGSKDFAVSTTSTSAAAVGTFTVSGSWTKAKIILIRVRDKAGKRAGYFYGHDTWITNLNIANGSTSAITTAARMIYALTSGSAWYEYSGQYGVYGYSISSAGVVTIRRRYNSTYSLTIDGTYACEVWALDYPDGKVLFDV